MAIYYMKKKKKKKNVQNNLLLEYDEQRHMNRVFILTINNHAYQPIQSNTATINYIGDS